jgi:hypothetical protein
MYPEVGREAFQRIVSFISHVSARGSRGSQAFHFEIGLTTSVDETGARGEQLRGATQNLSTKSTPGQSNRHVQTPLSSLDIRWRSQQDNHGGV